jgi:hypothetical protein
MNNIFKFALTSIAVASITFAGCKKDKVENPDVEEQELITTVKLHVTGANSFDKTFTYKVENGFGVTSPGTITRDDIALAPNTEYNMEVHLLNEKKNPAEDITEEVIAEKNDHLFLFEAQTSLLTLTDGNKDNNGAPFNQTIKVKTGAAGSGSLTVILKHEPANKNAANAADAGGETDVEATFNVVVQ